MAETQAMRPKHYTQLDGLRGLAIFAVFWHHYGTPPLWAGWWGWTGVDLFFVLSGFLITGILFDSVAAPRYFRNFYIRRALRIFPLYWAFWLLALLAVAIFHAPFDRYYWAWPAYLGNFTMVHALREGLAPNFYEALKFPIAGTRIYYLVTGHFWSLCVEEQYYLLWPLVVWMVRDRVKLIRLSSVGLIGVLALRIGLRYWLPVQWLDTDLVHKLMFTRVDTLLMGGILALWARGAGGLDSIRHRPLYATAAGALLLFVVSLHRAGTTATEDVSARWIQTYGYTLVAIICSAIMVMSLRGGRFARWLVWKPLVELGKISYGFYVLHMLLFNIWTTFGLPKPVGRLAAYAYSLPAFAITWALSWASFKYYETPWLRLKDKLAPPGYLMKRKKPELGAGTLSATSEPTV